MKTKILSLAFLSVCSIASVFGQDRTTVTANNSDISDNLDLRAVASIFGDAVKMIPASLQASLEDEVIVGVKMGKKSIVFDELVCEQTFSEPLLVVTV